MTFLYGTNLELVYSMPAIGATQSGSAITCLNTAATAPPFQLPALQNIWSPSSLTGKGLLVVAAGGVDSGANTLTTLRLSFDAASGTTANNTIAATGALTAPFTGSVTTGAWEMQVWMSCVGVSSELTSNWYAQGQLQISPTAATGVADSYAFGNTITAGIPQAIAMSNATSYFVNLCAQWQVNPTAMVCSQFMVFGLD